MIDGSMQFFALTLDKFIDHAAKWHPNVEVVTARQGAPSARVGYAELRARSKRVSSILQGFGIERGDRVATLAWNTQAHVEVWYAIMGMGAVCHTLNPRLMAEQLAAMLNRSKARILIVSSDLLPLAERISVLVDAIERIIVIDASLQEEEARLSLEAAHLEPLIGSASEDVPWGDFDENSPAGLCFTSGTTGVPKGVTYTHRSNFLHTLRAIQADTMAISNADCVLAVVPMFHANAWGLPFAVLAVGAKLVLPGRHSDGESLARLIKEEGVTIALGVPTLWLGLLEHLEATGETVPSLQRIVVGGAPLPPALMERLESRLGVIVQTSWGMTELSPAGTVAPPHEKRRSAAYSGRPAVGVDLLLCDSEGRALAEQRNVEGHLYVKGAAVVERYFGQDDVATNEDGWFATGDLARIDEGGNLMITGRAKDLIKSGGEWINPVEIETVIGALPEVSLAAVIGRQDEKWGERPILLVELRERHEISDETMMSALKGRIASWWMPDAIVRLPTMPLAATGKIDKTRLRRKYGGS